MLCRPADPLRRFCFSLPIPSYLSSFQPRVRECEVNSLGLAQQMIGSGAPGRASTLEPRLNAGACRLLLALLPALSAGGAAASFQTPLNVLVACPNVSAHVFCAAAPALAADMRALAAARAPDRGGQSDASPATACERDGGCVGVDTSNTQSEMMFLLLHALKSTPCQVIHDGIQHLYAVMLGSLPCLRGLTTASSAAGSRKKA